jgi:hypothetical protein
LEKLAKANAAYEELKRKCEETDSAYMKKQARYAKTRTLQYFQTVSTPYSFTQILPENITVGYPLKLSDTVFYPVQYDEKHVDQLRFILCSSSIMIKQQSGENLVIELGSSKANDCLQKIETRIMVSCDACPKDVKDANLEGKKFALHIGSDEILDTKEIVYPYKNLLIDKEENNVSKVQFKEKKKIKCSVEVPYVYTVDGKLQVRFQISHALVY